MPQLPGAWRPFDLLLFGLCLEAPKRQAVNARSQGRRQDVYKPRGTDALNIASTSTTNHGNVQASLVPLQLYRSFFVAKPPGTADFKKMDGSEWASKPESVLETLPGSPRSGFGQLGKAK